MRGLGALQRWSAPQYWGQGQPDVAGHMENLGCDARMAVRRSKRESWETLGKSAGRGTHGIPAAPLEHGEVHRILDGEPPARLTRHQVLRNPRKDQPETRRVRGRGAHYACGGYSAQLRSVSIHNPGGGIPWSTGLRYITA